MSTEEKSQAYDEALKQATKELQICGSLDCDAARQIFRLFPQLRKSEDERIRKWIFDLVNNMSFENLTVLERTKNEEWKKKVLDYLEKQKELDKMIVVSPEVWDNAISDAYENGKKDSEKQKENPEEPKIAFGDWGDKEKKEAIFTCLKYMRFIKKITNQEYNDLTEWLGSTILKFKIGDKIHLIDGTSPNYEDDCITIREIDTTNYIGEFKEGYVPIKEQDKWELVKEQKPVYASGTAEPDYGICDDYIPASLHHALKRHGWYATHIGEKPDKEVIKYVETTMEQKPAEWSDTNELVFKDICNHLKEEGYNGWIVLLNALRNGEFQPKQEWSDEDEKIVNNIVAVLGQYIDYKAVSGTGPGYATPRYAKEIDWLKSLRPSWKPNDEDEERLINTSISFLKDFADKGYENAVECIDWLKSKLNGNTCK